MKSTTLKQSSFVAYFSHLPPQEAIDRCSELQGAADICSDVDNWKAYVARRYGLKYSLQRPDLTTADQWMQHVLILEQVDLRRSLRGILVAPANTHGYAAPLFHESPATIRSQFEHMNWLLTFPFGENKPVSIIVTLPGMPLVISDATFHLCGFDVNVPSGVWLQALDDKHPSHDSTIFEAASLCHDWLLELLVPYYSSYIERGYALDGLRITSMNQEGQIFHNLVVPPNFNFILSRLQQLFTIENQAFMFEIILAGLEIVTISLKYLTSK